VLGCRTLCEAFILHRQCHFSYSRLTVLTNKLTMSPVLHSHVAVTVLTNKLTISPVLLTLRSPTWGWPVVTQNVPVYLFEAPAHLTNCSSPWRCKFRVLTKCGHFIDVRVGDRYIATKGKKLKSVPSDPRSGCQFYRHSVQVSCLQALRHIAIIHSFYTATLQTQ
jgi:hypothetical protein